MTDDELEARLRQFMPAGPGPALRAQVIDAATRPRLVPMTTMDWSLVAATVLLVGGMVATDATMPAVTASATERAWQAEVAAVAEVIGGGEDANRYARMIVPPPVLTLAMPDAEEQ